MNRIPLAQNGLVVEWFNESMQDLEFLQFGECFKNINAIRVIFWAALLDNGNVVGSRWEMHRLDAHWPQGVVYDLLKFDSREPGTTGMVVERNFRKISCDLGKQVVL